MIATIQQKISKLNKQKGGNAELIKDSLVASVIRGIAAISSLALNIVIGRYLGAEESGYFFLTLTIITVLSSFARLGTDNVTLRFVSVHSNKNEWREVQSVFKFIFKRVFIVSFLIGLIVAVFSKQIAIGIFNKKEMTNPLIWMGISVPLLSVAITLAYGLQGLKKVGPSVALQNISIPNFNILICFLIF